MEFILPSLFLIITIPLFAAMAVIVGAICLGLVSTVFKGKEGAKAMRLKRIAKLTCISGCAAIAFLGPAIIFFLPFVLYDMSCADASLRAKQKANEFVVWFSQNDKGLFAADSPDDKAIESFRHKLDSYGKFRFQLGPRHGPRNAEVRELSIADIEPGTTNAECIAEAAARNGLKNWLIGYPFNPPDKGRCTSISSYGVRPIETKPDNIFFTARRNADDDGIDVDFYTDYPVTRDKDYEIQPIDAYSSMYLGQYRKDCVMDKVHIMPTKKMHNTKTASELETIDKIQARFDKLMKPGEKQNLENVVTNLPCVHRYPSREKLLKNRNAFLFKPSVNEVNPLIKHRHCGVLRVVDIDADCAEFNPKRK